MPSMQRVTFYTPSKIYFSPLEHNTNLNFPLALHTYVVRPFVIDKLFSHNAYLVSLLLLFLNFSFAPFKNFPEEGFS